MKCHLKNFNAIKVLYSQEERKGEREGGREKGKEGETKEKRKKRKKFPLDLTISHIQSHFHTMVEAKVRLQKKLKIRKQKPLKYRLCSNFTKFSASVHYLPSYFTQDSTLCLAAQSSFSCMQKILINSFFSLTNIF